ncbi:MAG: hypothetical protein PS018_17350 [bacterium]|nr:hypothetical protein [bacterium]
MKARLLIAAAIGALISALLLVLEPLTDYALLSWEWPGISAAYLFWGATGGGAFPGIAIAWFVNAVVYGAAVFALLMLFRLLTKALPK